MTDLDKSDILKTGPYTGWEYDQNKHIFILSSSGKPIFSKYGDENELVTTFGLLQAVISIVIDSGDSIKCIRAGNLHDIFRKNPSSDIRQLLGSDTMRLMQATCQDAITSTPIAFESIQSVTCCKEIREEVTSYLSHCVDQSKAVLGILLCKDKLLGYAINHDTPLHLTTSDVVLLTNFVANSNSLRYNDHNWVPICMPAFNDSGLLQAYVSDFKVATLSNNSDAITSSSQILKPRPSTASTANASQYNAMNSNNKSNNSNVLLSNKHHYNNNNTVSDDSVTELTIILIASSADSDVFKQLLLGKSFIEKALNQEAMAQRLLHAIHHEQHLAVERYLDSIGCLHFMFKYRPMTHLLKHTVAAYKKDTEVNNQKIPSQYIATTMRFPLDSISTQECIWTQYQRLSICLRNGSSTVETTLLPIIHTTATGSESSSIIRNKTNIASTSSLTMKQTSFSNMNSASSSSKSSTVVGNKVSKLVVMEENSLDNNNFVSSASNQQQREDEDDAALAVRTEQLLSSLPSSDHSLSYIVLATGMVIVALATYDSELFVTFPATISPLEACTTADVLTRALKIDACELFQVNL